MDEFLNEDFLLKVIDLYARTYNRELSMPDATVGPFAQEMIAAHSANEAVLNTFGAEIGDFLSMALAGV